MLSTVSKKACLGLRTSPIISRKAGAASKYSPRSVNIPLANLNNEVLPTTSLAPLATLAPACRAAASGVKPKEFNVTTNISTTPDRSGSITVAEGVASMSNFFPPSHLPTGLGTGSYATFYNAAPEAEGFTTHSEFRPYVSEIGLYSENGELLIHGKLGKAIKLSDDIETTFIVRFDV